MPPAERRVLQVMKENIETITGRRGQIELLGTSATTAQIIAKVNEVLNRLQE